MFITFYKFYATEYDQLVLNLNTALLSIKNEQIRAGVMEKVADRHKDIADQMVKEQRVAEELLDTEKERLKGKVTNFQSGTLGVFVDDSAIDELLKKMDKVNAVSTAQVREEIKKLVAEFNNIKANANVEKGIFEGVSNLITEIANKEKELATTTGSRAEIVREEYNELVKTLGLSLEKISSQKTYNQILEKTNELSRQSQSYFDKEKADAKDLIKTEKERLNLKIKNLQQTKAEEYINTERLTEIKKAIVELDGSSTKQVRAEIQKLELAISGLASDANAKKILATSNSIKSLSDKLRDLNINATFDLGDVINALGNTIGKGVDYVKNLDEAYTDVAISMDITRDAFAEWTNDARAIAQANGQMTTSALDMVKIYASAGEEIEDIADRLEGTLQIQNVTQWSAEQTTSAVNSIVNQYKLLEKEINGTTGNISNAIQYAGDALVGISNELKVDNVTGIQEMIEAIDTAGGVMEQSGATMEWYMAVAGTLNETMNASGSEIGNAWKMISARIFSQAQAMEELGESSENIKIEALKAERALNSVGISVREVGDPSKLRSLQDILDDLSKKWDTLSDATKNYVAEGVAGNNRRNFFVTTMENYDRVLTLTNAGLNSQGELAKASEVRVNSLAGQIAILTDKFLSLMDGLNPVLYGLVDLGNTALDIVHSFGAIPTTIGLASAAFLTLSDSGRQLSSTIIEAISPLNNLNTFLMQKAGLMKEDGVVTEQLSNAIGKTVDNMSNMSTSVVKASTSVNVLSKSQIGASTASGVMKTGLLGVNTGLIATKAAAIAASIGVTALQAALSLGLSIAITAVISGITKLVSGFKSLGEQSDSAVENMQKLNNSIEESKAFEENLNSLEKMSEQLRGVVDGSKEQEELLSKIIAIKQDIAANGDKENSIINNANLSLEEQLALLRQINKEKLQESVGDFRKETKQSTIDRLQNETNTLSQDITNRHDAIQSAKNTGSSSVEFNGMSYDLSGFEKATKQIEESFKSSYTQLMAINSQMQSFEDNGVDVGLKMGEVSRNSSELFNSLTSVNNTLDKTESSTNQISNNMSDIAASAESLEERQRSATESYLNSATALEEAKALLKDINENGMNTDNASELFNMFEDYSGNITNAAAAQDFLNDKISEMQKAHDDAYAEMLKNDETFWNEKMKNSEEWKNYVNGMNDEVRKFGIQVLGEESQDYVNFINERFKQREVDLNNAKTMAEAERILSSGLVNDLSAYFAKLVNDKGAYRGTDYSNIIDFLNQQGVAEVRTIQQLRDLWQQYYEKKAKAIRQELYDLDSKLDVVYEGDRENLYSDMNALNKENQKIQNLFNSLDLSFKGVGGGLSQNTVGSSGLKKPSSGSSSSGGSSSNKGSGSSSTEREIADLELAIDRYYALNDAINDVNNALDKNSIQKDNAKTIEEYNKIVEEEIRLTNQKIEALENLRREQEKEASELRNSIANQGGAFDSNGNLTNYHKLLTDAQNKANKLSGTAKENAIANVNALKEMIDKYTELTNSSIPNTASQILEMKNTIEAIRKEQEEMIEQVERLGERYYTVLQAIKKVDNELALIKAKQENAHGKERVELLVREIELMKEKQKLLQQQQNESITEASEIYNDLKEQGVQFDEDGTIKNYDALMKKLTDKVNSLVGTARDEELKKAESLIELIEKYDDLVKDTIPSLGVEWIEANNDIIALEKSKLETIADVQKQITQAITSELKKRTEETKKEIDKQKQLYLDSYEEEDYQNELAKEQRKLDEIQQQINNIARDTSLAGQLKLQDLMQQYQEQQDIINNIIRDHEKQEGSDRFDEEMDKLDENLENALDPENMAQLVADALATGFVSIGDEVIKLDKLMADFAVESEGAITALSNTIRAEMIESLKEASLLVENLGSSYQTLIGYNETLSKNKNLNDVKTMNSSSPKIEFNAPILTIEGDVTQDLESRLHEFANQVQNTVMKTVGRALSTI